MKYCMGDEDLKKKYPHFERIIDEKFDLDSKIKQLLNFTESTVFKNLQAEESELLREQLKYMELYSEVLNKRIDYIRKLT